jgi:molybdenum cofactor biosynthesis protein B
MPGLDDSKAFVPLAIAVLTVSDTRSIADDKSGATLAERIAKAGHKVAARAIVSDDVEKIRAQVRAWIADPEIDVVISTGGTGFTGRDVTPEAVEPLFEKKMEGFATLFLMVSFGKIGTSAIQTRATAGVAAAPARTPGTTSSCTSSITATAPAISSRSCRGSTSTCAAPRRRGRRCDRVGWVERSETHRRPLDAVAP